jgi:hypothetical protein
MARTPERTPKENTPSNRGFGIAWLLFAIGLGFHVADEATHNFLSTYNPSVRAIRARFPFLPLPTFTFAVWLTLLIVGILLLLCLSPLAFRGSGWLRIVSLPLGIVVGVLKCRLAYRQLSLFSPVDARCLQFTFAAACRHLFARS